MDPADIFGTESGTQTSPRWLRVSVSSHGIDMNLGLLQNHGTGCRGGMKEPWPSQF